MGKDRQLRLIPPVGSVLSTPDSEGNPASRTTSSAIEVLVFLSWTNSKASKKQLDLLCWQSKEWEGFPGGSDSKESAFSAGDLGSIPGLGRSLGKGNGYPLQYSWLGNPMGRECWQATVHRVAKSWTQLSDEHFHFTFNIQHNWYFSFINSHLIFSPTFPCGGNHCFIWALLK